MVGKLSKKSNSYEGSYYSSTSASLSDKPEDWSYVNSNSNSSSYRKNSIDIFPITITPSILSCDKRGIKRTHRVINDPEILQYEQEELEVSFKLEKYTGNYVNIMNCILILLFFGYNVAHIIIGATSECFKAENLNIYLIFEGSIMISMPLSSITLLCWAKCIPKFDAIETIKVIWKVGCCFSIIWIIFGTAFTLSYSPEFDRCSKLMYYWLLVNISLSWIVLISILLFGVWFSIYNSRSRVVN